jgi:ketopantoate reductase
MRIAVIGAGAVGSALGSLLWRAGEEVVLVGRAAHVAALREDRAMLQDAPIVVLQNGLRGDELAATVVPESQLVSGVVVLHAQYLVAGHVVNVLPDALAGAVAAHKAAGSLQPQLLISRK